MKKNYDKHFEQEPISLKSKVMFAVILMFLISSIYLLISSHRLIKAREELNQITEKVREENLNMNCISIIKEENLYSFIKNNQGVKMLPVIETHGEVLMNYTCIKYY